MKADFTACSIADMAISFVLRVCGTKVKVTRDFPEFSGTRTSDRNVTAYCEKLTGERKMIHCVIVA